MSNVRQQVEARTTLFRNSRWTVGVIGLGYVGLPLTATASAAGLAVIGFDVDATKVAAVDEARSYVDDVTDADLQRVLQDGGRYTTDEASLSEADVIIITVPSPLGRYRQPDLTYIEAAAATISRVARPGQLVALESTSYPGTTEDYIVPAVEAAGLTLDQDVYVAYSPERVDPGNVCRPADIPKVVGGVTEMSGIVAEGAYSRLVSKVYRVKSARVAELTKLLENTYRAVNIAMVNEFDRIAESLDVDVWEVIDAAATKPFGFQAFYPGPGVGGHCIPLDPQFLAWRARETKVATRFIDLAEDINRQQPAYVGSRICDLLNARGLPVSGSRVLALGVSYKRNVSDLRESPAMEVVMCLRRQGAQLGALDVHVPAAQLRELGLTPVEPDADLRGWDLAVVLTDHDGVDYAAVAEQVDTVFDARGVYRRLDAQRQNVVVL